MNEPPVLRGTWFVLPTPFGEDGSLDLASQRRVVESAVAWGVHWVRYPERARGHANNPVMAQFWGAPPMALMTLGTGSAG